MRSPWALVKIRWYRRQANGAIRFLRYLDRILHESGAKREDIRRAWRDFSGSAYYRNAILDKLAVINKIKIRRQNKTRLQKMYESLAERYSRAMSENIGLRKQVDELKEYEKKCTAKADEILAGIEAGQLKETPVEVHQM